MRRTTLGGLTSSQLNARPSLAGSRLGALGEGGGKALPPPAPRAERSLGDLSAAPSLSGAAGAPIARGSLQRRTSVYSGSGSALRQDPRPVTDKSFVAGCTQTLITYLATHGYDRPLSPKLLSSNKEFGAVVAFLARRIDPGAAPLTGRVEEEVPALFKRLRYPFSIPKSALQAVGSPHTWPALVAALAWLVELLQYEEHASKATSSVFDAGCGAATTAARADAGAVEQSALGGERAFFDFCAASYGAYISGDDAAVAALDEQLEAHYARHDDALAAAVERLGGENAGLEERLVAARASLVATADLHAQKAEHEENAAKLGALIAQLQAHVAALQRKAAERRAEVESREAELAAARADNDSLASQVACQRISSADVARMTADRAAEAAILAGVTAQAVAAEETARELAVAVQHRADEVDAALGVYHTTGLALKVLPAGAKRGKGGAYVLEGMQPHSAPTAALDAAAELLRCAIRPGLEALRDEYKARWREAGSARLRLDTELDASESVLAERRDERSTLEADVLRAEGAIIESKERIRAAVASAEASATALEAEATALRASSEVKLHNSDAAVAALRAAYDELAAQCAAEAAQTQQTLLAALDALMTHKQAVQDALARCAGVLFALADDLGADATQVTWVAP